MSRISATTTDDDYDDCHACNSIHLVVPFVFWGFGLSLCFSNSLQRSKGPKRLSDFDPFSDYDTIESE